MEMHKKFGSSRPEPKVGPTFEIEGPWGSEEFHAKPTVAGRVVPEFVASISAGKGRMSNPDTVQFIHDCLADQVLVRDPGDGEEGEAVYEDCDDRERWQALMSDDDRPVHAQDVTDAALYLIDFYYDRPTGRSRR